jgi:putative molybdopterin biosynthesis protein
MRNIYLSMVTVDEALQAAKAAVSREELVAVESVPSEFAAGRVTAAPVFSRLSSPTFHSAAMDGYAVRSRETFAAREGAPIVLAKGVQCVPANTGNPLPEGFDAVIMIEHVLRDTDAEIQIERPAFPWQHVRRIGEDIVATELLLPQNHPLTPYDVGALLSAGVWELDVWERIRLHVIPTGDEVLDFRTRPEPKPGQVVDSNSQVLLSLARSWGCEARSVPTAPDRPEALELALDEALASDAHIVVIGAGSSAGSKDYTRQTMERFGRVLVHGINVMPGKPSLVAVARGKLMIGAPGYPVSAVVCHEELVRPLVAWLGRRPLEKRPEIEVELTRKVPSRPGMREILRLAVGRVGERFVSTPLGRGAGMITTLTRAQALAHIPVDSEGLEQGARVSAELLVPREVLERTLVIIGSHDNTMDLLANELMGLAEPVQLASTHVGSMGGLTALRNGATLVAGAHLFDPATGDYNFPFIVRHLPETPVRVVNMAIRHQGFIVPKGNPKGVRCLGDVATQGLRFINRQRGAGTRILLDHHLKEEGLRPEDLPGYDKEEFTHMAVAVNVLTGAADCGLGIHAAARALDLDFVPLARERYDLVIAAEAFETDPKIAALLELLRSEAFQARIVSLGGYEIGLSGREMQPGQGLA